MKKKIFERIPPEEKFFLKIFVVLGASMILSGYFLYHKTDLRTESLPLSEFGWEEWNFLVFGLATVCTCFCACAHDTKQNKK